MALKTASFGRARNVSTALCLLTLLAMTSTVNAQAKKGKAVKAEQVAPTPAPAGPVAAPKTEDKVDITDLENKYWAPKDTDFSVVQNRTFSKQNKLALTPVWGMPINDPYSEGNLLGVVGNYFWSERMGVQLTYLTGDLKDNDATVDIGKLSAASGARPDFGRFTSSWSIGYNFVPFYAKMSFWGKRILYFDMAFTPHIGMTTYEQQIEFANKEVSALTYGLDVTQLFFFSKSFAIRVDLKNQWHQEDVVKFRNSGGLIKGDKVRDITTQDTMFLIGPTFYW